METDKVHLLVKMKVISKLLLKSSQKYLNSLNEYSPISSLVTPPFLSISRFFPRSTIISVLHILWRHNCKFYSWRTRSQSRTQILRSYWPASWNESFTTLVKRNAGSGYEIDALLELILFPALIWFQKERRLGCLFLYSFPWCFAISHRTGDWAHTRVDSS